MRKTFALVVFVVLALPSMTTAQMTYRLKGTVRDNAKGEWTILGLTSGVWVFEATGDDVVPQVVVLPINFSNRKPQSATGNSFSWDLPLTVRRTTHAGLKAAAAAATEGRVADAITSVGIVASEPDADLLCSAGEVALLVRQHSLAGAIFEQILKQDPRHGCAMRGRGSAALMHYDYDTAAKMLWNAIDLVPRDQRAALGAAVKDLQATTVAQYEPS
ncbi:MAG TPA: hypothetical protein VMO26_15125 [Vicinamibacterales bacterium]|nr:hypothetical protein [Vicinamibacterales bacterium]